MIRMRAGWPSLAEGRTDKSEIRGCPWSEGMPDIVVYMKEGRTVDQKRKLVRSLTDAVVNSLGVREDMVEVVIVDQPGHNFARGGTLLSDKAT